MSIVDFVCHDLQINNTYVFSHANGSASDINSFLKECQNVPTPQWVQYPHSPGARLCKLLPLDIGRKLSCDFSDEIYQIKSKGHLYQVMQFPPKYLHQDKSSCESISSMFVNCMETEKTAGLVTVGYDVSKRSWCSSVTVTRRPHEPHITLLPRTECDIECQSNRRTVSD